MEAATTGTNLHQQGCRFVFRNGRYTWTHALEMVAGDLDCTDMDDDAFEAFVRAHA